MSWPRYLTEEEIEAMNARRIGEKAVARVRDGCAPPDLLFEALGELQHQHEQQSFIRAVQKALERQP